MGLTEAERAQVESAKEPGERCTHRTTRQHGIIKQKTEQATLVWWGTGDSRPVMTWERPDDLLPYDGAVWPDNREQGSPSGVAGVRRPADIEIDLQDKDPT